MPAPAYDGRTARGSSYADTVIVGGLARSAHSES